MVYVETEYTMEEVSRPERVDTYMEAFGRAVDRALEPANTTAYLRHLADQLE
jgi:hypothetical protein